MHDLTGRVARDSYQNKKYANGTSKSVVDLNKSLDVRYYLIQNPMTGN